MAKKKKNEKRGPYSDHKCGQCGAKLIPSGCGCENEDCKNHVGKWPKPGTFYSPPR